MLDLENYKLPEDLKNKLLKQREWIENICIDMNMEIEEGYEVFMEIAEALTIYRFDSKLIDKKELDLYIYNYNNHLDNEGYDFGGEFISEWLNTNNFGYLREHLIIGSAVDLGVRHDDIFVCLIANYCVEEALENIDLITDKSYKRIFDIDNENKYFEQDGRWFKDLILKYTTIERLPELFKYLNEKDFEEVEQESIEELVDMFEVLIDKYEFKFSDYGFSMPKLEQFKALEEKQNLKINMKYF